MKRSIGIQPALIPTPVLVIGTYDHSSQPNAMVAAWGGIASGNPLSVSFSVQKIRHTYQALVDRKECTISIPSDKYIKETDFMGVRSGKDINKFKATGLTPIKGEKVNAPYVSEFPIILECHITHVTEIGIHIQFIAEVLDVKVDENLISPDGSVNTDNTQFFFYDPFLRAYRGTGKILMQAFTVREIQNQ